MLEFCMSDRLGDARDPSGRTLLHLSAENRETDLTRHLIRQGCDVDAQDNSGMTPLMLAVLNSDDDTIRILLNARANVYIDNRLGQNVLKMAFTAEILERSILLQLLRSVQNISCTIEEIALRLIDAGCPIYRAVILRNTKVIRKMIELGVDVDTKNSHGGSTALFHAVMECDPNMVKLLLKYKANVNAEDVNRFTAVGGFHTCKCNCDKCFGRFREKLEVLRILIDDGAALTSITSLGLFQIWIILQCGSREAVGIVLRSNIDFAARDQHGLSLLDYIAQNVSEGIAEELKPHIHKFDVNAFDALTKSPLLRAVECGNLRVVKLLLDNGADVNCAEVTGETPLIKCFSKTRTKDERRLDKCVELLLEYGANPQIVSNYEDAPTIFDMATRTKRFNRVKLVIARLAMMVGEGVPVTEMVTLKLANCYFYRSYFGSCWLVLRERYGSANLFQLLTGNKIVLTTCLTLETKCLRKLILLSEDEKMKKSHVLYYNMLKRRIAKVLGTVRYDGCDCVLPWTDGSKLNIQTILEMKEKVLAKHLRCTDCLRNLLRMCYSTVGIPREVSLRKRMATTIRKTDLQDGAAVVIGMIFGGRLSRCHIVTNKILEYLDDESMEVLSCEWETNG